jgi:hypothetical protein
MNPDLQPTAKMLRRQARQQRELDKPIVFCRQAELDARSREVNSPKFIQQRQMRKAARRMYFRQRHGI